MGKAFKRIRKSLQDAIDGEVIVHRPVQKAAAAFVITQAGTPEGQKRAARIVAEDSKNVIEKDATK